MQDFYVAEDTKRKSFIDDALKDLHSFETELPNSTRLYPNICSVCDSIPKHAHWHNWVDIRRFKELCCASNLKKMNISKYYPSKVIKGYTVPHRSLEALVLSPNSVINRTLDTILVCKTCHQILEQNFKVPRTHWCRNLPPKDSICNGYVIGEAPKEIKELNPVELSLISKVQTYCQTWMFKGGPHQQIKGWHTFFKNRPGSHVGTIRQLQWAELKGNILVVICGPFTKTQKALTMNKVMVRPNKVIEAYKWLIQNNIYYANDSIPSVEDIPIPKIFEEKV